MNKTCINSLNFIKEDQEKSLLTKEQPQVVFDIFAFIYIILNENYKQFENKGNAIIENLFDVLYKKYNVDSLSKCLKLKIK